MLNINPKLINSMKIKNRIDSSSPGVSIVFVFMITSAVLAVAFGVSGILIKQSVALRGVGNSVVAFFAADSGIENFLLTKPAEGIPETSLSNYSKFWVDVRGRGEDGCPDSSSITVCIKSIGTFEGERRAVEIIY
jgi:hypothetical protein